MRRVFRSAKKSILEGLSEGVQVHPLGDRTPNGLVVDIGQIHHLDDFEPAILQNAPEQILENIGPEIADVGVVVDRRTAGIEADLAGVDGFQNLQPLAQAIKNLQGHPRASLNSPG
jgi:hypothetical protein